MAYIWPLPQHQKSQGCVHVMQLFILLKKELFLLILWSCFLLKLHIKEVSK